MSYSCTNTGKSQDPSSAKKSGGNKQGNCGGSSGEASSSNSHNNRASQATANPIPAEAMKVKVGCNTADVGVPVTTEEELLANTIITPEDVLGLQKITQSKSNAR